VRHIPDGVLRRLDDEPLAVPDRVSEHLAGCGRCSARRARIADDTEQAARLLSGPQLVPDTDLAWARLERELRRSPQEGGRRRRPMPVLWRRPRFPSLSLRTGLAIGAAGVVVAGTAAAATLTTIFAPTHVAPVSLSQGDLQAITSLVGLGNGRALGGFSGPNGSTTVRFGTIRWSTSGPTHPVASAAQAAADAGFPISLPVHLPAGVGAVRQFIVQPRVSATVTFNSAAAGVGGSSVTVDGGPAVLAEYLGAAGIDTPTLGVATMRRPTALSTGASLSQIEAFLLGQPAVPPGLAEEVRLLGDLRTIFPVPVPPGASVRSVRVAGWPGVLLADSSNAAAGVVWEDGRGMVHVVAGILDSQDVLNVAQQVG
jgi:hypothetical protein